MHNMEQRLLFYLMLMILSIGIHLKLLEMVCQKSRKEVPCEPLGVCTLVHFNQNFSDEGPFYFSRSGEILYFYCG